MNEPVDVSLLSAEKLVLVQRRARGVKRGDADSSRGTPSRCNYKRGERTTSTRPDTYGAADDASCAGAYADTIRASDDDPRCDWRARHTAAELFDELSPRATRDKTNRSKGGAGRSRD